MAARRGEGPEEAHRERLLAGLRGRVVEVGCGPGLNFPHYPPAVTEVLAVEPEPTLREAAHEAAAEAGVEIRVVPGTADELPAADSSCDAAVASLVLCSVPDQAVALAEIRRVLATGGELRFYEHVGSRGRVARAIERLADTTLWPRLAGGCHLARDTLPAIERAGFDVECSEEFRFSPGPPVPPLPHVLGVARLAAADA